MDGDRDPQSWEREFGLETTSRSPALKVVGNWAMALVELYLRNPTADRYAIFQDDLITYRNLRDYLENQYTPDRLHYLNLYTFPSNQAIAPPGHVGWFVSNQLGKGAVALVFCIEAVEALFTSLHFIRKPRCKSRGWKSVDGGIVTAIKQAGGTEYCHSPTLCQHTGVQSSRSDRQRGYVAPPQPFAPGFLGEDHDALSFLVDKGER